MQTIGTVLVHRRRLQCDLWLSHPTAEDDERGYIILWLCLVTGCLLRRQTLDLNQWRWGSVWDILPRTHNTCSMYICLPACLVGLLLPYASSLVSHQDNALVIDEMCVVWPAMWIINKMWWHTFCCIFSKWLECSVWVGEDGRYIDWKGFIIVVNGSIYGWFMGVVLCRFSRDIIAYSIFHGIDRGPWKTVHGLQNSIYWSKFCKSTGDWI